MTKSFCERPPSGPWSFLRVEFIPTPDPKTGGVIKTPFAILVHDDGTNRTEVRERVVADNVKQLGLFPNRMKDIGWFIWRQNKQLRRAFRKAIWAHVMYLNRQARKASSGEK